MVKLGSGNGILNALSQFHEESTAHGGLADLAANSRDAGATVWRLQGGFFGPQDAVKDVLCFSDDGPGPCIEDQPTAESLHRMIKPGISTSTDEQSKIGQAGVGSLSGSLVLGSSVLFATRGSDTLHLLLVSEGYNDWLRNAKVDDAEVLPLDYPIDPRTGERSR